MSDSTDRPGPGHSHHPRSGWGPGPDPDLRISDADRNEVTNALCTHFADGRLTEEEFNERAAAATAARTGRDLRPLLADLPPLHRPAPPARPASRHPWRWVVAAVVLVWLASASAVHWAAHAPGRYGGPWGGPPPFAGFVVLGVVVWLMLRRRAHRR